MRAYDISSRTSGFQCAFVQLGPRQFTQIGRRGKGKMMASYWKFSAVIDYSAI